MNTINWKNPEAMISTHFSVKEALWLPRWSTMHIPDEKDQEFIIETAKRMDMVRNFLGSPIIPFCWIRPYSANCPDSKYHGMDYNKLVGGAQQSMHLCGGAVDWYTTESCDIIREKLVPKLEEFNIRMENLPNANWIHCDIKFVGYGMNRYFIP
jgi:hypothetical protein